MKKSVFHINRLSHFNAFAFVSASLLVLIFTAMIFPISKKTEYVSAAIDNSEYALALNTSTDIDINVRPTAGGKLVVAKDTISGTTNAPSGYKLFVSTNASTNDIYLNGDASTEKKIAATTGTFDSPTALVVDSETTATWGYAVAGLHNFDATYDTENPSSEAKFAAMPVVSNEQLIHEHSGIANGDTTDIYYGTRVAASTVSGIYTTTINYISLTDISSEVTGELTVNPAAILEGTGSSEVELFTSLSTNFELGEVSATINNEVCDTVEVTSQNPLKVSCGMDFSSLVTGNYDVVVNVPKLGKSYTAVGGLRVVPPDTTVTLSVPADGYGTLVVTTPDGQGGSTSSQPDTSASVVVPLHSGYSVSDNVLTFDNGVTVTATPDNSGTAITVFSGWSNEDGAIASGTSGTISSLSSTITASFFRYSCNPNATTLDEAICMQDVGASVIESTPLHKSKQLLDERDNKLYWVTKMKDGNLWMTQNLDYDIVAGTNIVSNDDGTASIWDTSATYKPVATTNVTIPNSSFSPSTLSNSTASYNLGNKGFIPSVDGDTMTDINCTIGNNSDENCHYHLGNYYTRAAVSAGQYAEQGSTIGYRSSSFITQSVCPQGWTLPDMENMRGDLVELTKLYTDFSDEATSNAIITSWPLYLAGWGIYDVARNSQHYSTSNYAGNLRQLSNNSQELATSQINGDGAIYVTGMTSVTTVRCVAIKSDSKLSVETMQEITPEIVDKMRPGVSKQLLDERDNKLYWVAKMDDGNLWMTQNLDYDTNGSTDPGDVGYIAGSETQSVITCTEGNNSGADCHYHEGNYYDYDTATAGSGNVAKNIDATDSICPSGWRLPTGNSYKEAPSYGKLTDAKGVTNGAPSDQSANIDPLYLSGEYWTSLATRDITKAYSLITSSNSTDPAALATKTDMKHVRCVAENALDKISSMQEMTKEIVYATPDGATKQLLDERDNKLYWVTKVEGNIWMTQNLDYDLSTDNNVMSTWDRETVIWDSSSIAYAPHQTLTDLNSVERLDGHDDSFSYDPGNNGYINGNLEAIDCSSTENMGKDCHYHKGNYYQKQATNMEPTSFGRTASICPNGWVLPMRTLYYFTWYTIYDSVTSSNATSADYRLVRNSFDYLAEKHKNDSTSEPLYLNKYGKVYAASKTLNDEGSAAYYWMSEPWLTLQIDSAGNISSPEYDPSDTSDTYSRRYDSEAFTNDMNSVRCVANLK